MAQQLHLDSSVLHGHGTNREGLAAHHLGGVFLHGFLVQIFGGFRHEGVLPQPLAQLGAVAVNLLFQLDQRLVDGQEQVVLRAGLGTENNVVAQGNGDFHNAKAALFLAHFDVQLGIGGQITAHGLGFFLDTLGNGGGNDHIAGSQVHLHMKTPFARAAGRGGPEVRPRVIASAVHGPAGPCFWVQQKRGATPSRHRLSGCFRRVRTLRGCLPRDVVRHRRHFLSPFRDGGVSLRRAPYDFLLVCQ